VKLQVTLLKMRRLGKGLTQKELGSIVGIPQSHISMIENRKMVIRSESMEIIAEIMNDSVDRLFDDDGLAREWDIEEMTRRS
jgi:transcriptional regulator with XRE-family HTH domain